jgi:hypothetical protein
MRIVPITSAEVRLVQGRWAFADRNADTIAAYWQKRIAESPSLFDGEVVVLRSWALHGHKLVGECVATSYRSFLYWRENGHPDNTVSDFFAAAAVHSAEGWLILGRSAPGMSNAGEIYPPCGSLHRGDLVGTVFDLDGSIIRELHEETGIELRRDQLGPALLIETSPQIVVVRPVRLQRSARDLVAGMTAHLARMEPRELADVVVIKGPGDIQPAHMPAFIGAYVDHVFRDPAGPWSSNSAIRPSLPDVR